ncbi:MAG: nuclear transport factor 2 family protein [Saprospiraceae bacterium]
MKKLNSILSVLVLICLLSSCADAQSTKTAIDKVTSQGKTLSKEVTKMTNKDKAVALLKSIETGAKEPVAYINAENYTQHNLGVADGLAGFGAVLHMAPPEGFKVKVIRSFEDGDYVFTHSEYDFFGPKAGFDIFRFENGLIVEHWDNLSALTPANPSGRTQLDGPAKAEDVDKTEANRTLVSNFITDVLMNGKADKMTDYISTETYLQHNSGIADGLAGLGAAFKYFTDNDLVMIYEKTHAVLAQGNFVLTVSEGKFGKGDHTSFYDLFRIADGKIVEHWDVIETIMPESDRKNENGKFGF